MLAADLYLFITLLRDKLWPRAEAWLLVWCRIGENKTIRFYFFLFTDLKYAKILFVDDVKRITRFHVRNPNCNYTGCLRGSCFVVLILVGKEQRKQPQP